MTFNLHLPNGFRNSLLFLCSITAVAFIASLAVPHLATGQVVTANKQWHVSGKAMPTSLTVPVTNEGRRALTTNAYVDFIVISNTDTLAHTVLVEDGQMTPFLFYNNYTIPASTTQGYNLGGMLFTSGVKWSASSATVQATLTGH